MKDAYYGRVDQTPEGDLLDRCAEEVALRGFAIVQGIVDPSRLAEWRKRIDDVYRTQEDEFGADALDCIQDRDVCRAPLLYDRAFLELAAHPRILAIASRLLGGYHILHLQNAIINRPERRHHQTSWHRDLPHQNFVISRPLSINTLIAIDEFSVQTGATEVIPCTHRSERMPSDAFVERHGVVAAMAAGSAVVFDSMLFHRATPNRSAGPRRAINQVYTVPILKQQYDFPAALGSAPGLGDAMEQLLGYGSRVPEDDRHWRRARAARLGTGG